MKTSQTFLDRLINRLDQLDASSVQNYVLRLVREKGFLETIFNSIKEGVIVFDRSMEIHYVNPAGTALLGIPEKCEGQRIDRFLRDVDWNRLMSADPDEWHRVSFQEIEVSYPIHRFLHFYLVPCESEVDEDFPLVSLIVHDVTELHRDTEETIESQKIKAITMLAAGVAHEIGNPLNSLNIHLQLLKRKISKLGDREFAEDSEELLNVAAQEVQRLDSIINNFLKAVRPGKPNFQSISIIDLLSSSLKFMQREIEDRNILVEAAWDQPIPLINGDPDLLRQAFYNIIKNAVQAMKDGGILKIGCWEIDNTVEIRFVDTGKGISHEDLTRIMEPYFTTRSGGTGLGLWIVDQTIRSHGGELGIDTEAGKGTVFTIRLPLFDRKVRLLEMPQAFTEEPEISDE